ncbi:APC family permease [candidate division KSB1 bacterium]|nr:APC family permease [candidate division KSB1 bacterium]
MMEDNLISSFKRRVRTLVIGDARNPNDPHIFHKLSLIAFFAWVGLGADGLSSSCYGPEEAFLSLQGHFYLGILVALGSVITIFVISASYSQIIELFPTGGGGYVVASKLLSPTVGMVSGSALLIDYVLTITLSIASGADAIFSFLPAQYYPYKLTFAMFGLLLLILLNLRGIKESVVPLVPIFLIFIITHVTVIIYSLFSNLTNISAVASTTIADIQKSQTELGFLGMILLVLRAYSMGAGTYTGIEAVSNGLPILREPKVATAKQTMRYMSFSLAFMVFGLMLGYILFRVEHVPGKTLNAVLLNTLTSGWNPGLGYIFVLVTLISEAVLLFVASQTGFLDGPRVLANMAADRWLPSRFTMLSDRLVTQNGILLMGGAACILMLLTRGSVRFMVVLYSINVFITFFLSQLGMVRHWWQERKREIRWRHKLLVNGIGMFLTAFILISVATIKFYEGGWITIFVTSSLVFFALRMKRHYNNTGRLLKRLDTLVEVAQSSIQAYSSEKKVRDRRTCPTDRTAIIMVNGFNGLGLHTLFGAIRLFDGDFRNFVFVQIGFIDAGVFKGSEEINQLEAQVKVELNQYIEFMQQQGYEAEGVSAMGIDVVNEVEKIAPELLKKYPRAIFFGGQLVFPTEPMFSRWLHNYTAFSIQRRFYYRGIPVVLLPIRI